MEKDELLDYAKFDANWGNAYIVHAIEAVNRRKWG